MKKTENEADLTDDQIAAVTWERFLRAVDPHDKWAKEALKFEDFFYGKQWDDDDLQKLKTNGNRPALTINLIKPAIMAIIGEQQKTRAEITLKPRNSRADVEVATILSQILQYIDSDVSYGDIESQAFFDACITDRGFIDVRMGFDKNINGDVVMTADNPKQTVLDPDCRSYDPDEWPGVFEQYWRSMDFLEATYGKDKADKIRLGSTLDFDYVDATQSIRWSDDRIARDGSQSSPQPVNSGNGLDKFIESVRVVEHQYFVHTEAWCFLDPVTGDIIDPRCDLDETELAPMAMERGVELVKMTRKRVRWVVIARNVVLFNGWSAYPFLTKAGVFPIWMRGRPTGIVRDMISPQEQLNKIESQELHVINTTANSGWMYEDGSILNLDDAEIAANGAETGLVLKVRKGAQFPEKIQPNQIPSGLAHKASKNVEYLRFISMVNDAMLGFSSPEVSGVALDEKKDSGTTAFVPAFANLKKTRATIAKRLVWMVQNFYTQPRMIRITDYSVPERPDIDVAMNVPDEMGNVLNNVTIGRYDIVLSTAPARDTHEDGQFAQLMELRGANVAVPDDEVVRRSNLSDKFPLAERIAKMQGFGEPSEQEIQIQSMMQQMQLQEMQFGLDKQAAEIQELQSRAELNMMKAQELRVKAEAAMQAGGQNTELLNIALEREKMAMDFQSRREALMAKMETDRAAMQTKIQIAQMQIGVKRDGMLHQSAIKRAQEGSRTQDIQRKENTDKAGLAFKALLQTRDIEAKERIAAKKATTAKAAKKQPQKKKS